jgi:hypothetical protein
MVLFKSLILNLNKIVKRIYDTGYLPMPHEIKQRINAVCGLEGYQKFLENKGRLIEIFIPEEGYETVYLIYGENAVIVNSPLECAVYVHGGWSPPIYQVIDMTTVFLSPITTYPLIVVFLLIFSTLISIKKKRENK